MKVKDEVLKIIDGLKKDGFNPMDAVFEGAIDVKEDTTLDMMDKLIAVNAVSGVVRVIFTVEGDANIRFVEIPVGKQQEESQA